MGSSVSGNRDIKKDLQSLKWLLEAKKVPYKEYDLSTDTAARLKAWMKSQSRELPQLFVDGEYIGVSFPCGKFVLRDIRPGKLCLN